MSEVIRRLKADHANFARLLDLLGAKLGGVEDAQGHANYPLMLDIMVYMTHYPDQFHHPKEDLVFARMAERDRAMRPIVDGLAKDHQTLASKGAAFCNILRDVADGELVRRDAIDSLGREYIDALRAHIRTEEERAFSLAVALLEAQDWAEIDETVTHMDDPLFGPVVEQDHRVLYEHIFEEDSIPEM